MLKLECFHLYLYFFWKVMFASKDPTYDECFTFFVHSVNSQVLNVEVNLSYNHNLFYNIKQLFLLLHTQNLINITNTKNSWYYYIENNVFLSFILWPQVKEHEKKSSLGKLTLPLVRLLNLSDMTMDQRFQLERSGANSQIKMKVVLRVREWTTAAVFIFFSTWIL